MTTLYISRLVRIAERAAEANASAFEKASSALAATLEADGLVHLFGSGHSVLPTQETFPRYGSYVGFNPLTDPRVMWHNVLGAGGVRELLWLERTEGYAEKFLDHQPLNPGDSIVIFGHSGRNAGQFLVLHAMAVDKLGNVYTGEVEGKRIQKFKLVNAGALH